MTLFKLQYKELNNRIISGFDPETKGCTNMLNSKTATYNFCSQMNPKTRPENVMAYFILIPFDCCLIFRSQLNLALVTYYLRKPWRGGKGFCDPSLRDSEAKLNKKADLRNCLILY